MFHVIIPSDDDYSKRRPLFIVKTIILKNQCPIPFDVGVVIISASQLKPEIPGPEIPGLADH